MASMRGPSLFNASAGPGPGTPLDQKDQPRKLSFDEVRYFISIYGNKWGENFAKIQDEIKIGRADQIFQKVSAAGTGLYPSLVKIVTQYTIENPALPDYKTFSLEQQFIFTLLLDSETLASHPEINPIFRQIILFLDTPAGRRFYVDDSMLTPFGNHCNKAYIGILLTDACLSLPDELKIDSANTDIFNKQLTTWTLNLDQFKTSLSRTRWGSTLDAKKLFRLATNFDARRDLFLGDYLQLIVWLGDPGINPKLVIPAPLAIDFYLKLLTENSSALKLFQCFKSGVELDNLSPSEKIALEPVLRFGQARLFFLENSPIYS